MQFTTSGDLVPLSILDARDCRSGTPLADAQPHAARCVSAEGQGSNSDREFHGLRIRRVSECGARASGGNLESVESARRAFHSSCQGRFRSSESSIRLEAGCDLRQCAAQSRRHQPAGMRFKQGARLLNVTAERRIRDRACRQLEGSRPSAVVKSIVVHRTIELRVSAHAPGAFQSVCHHSQPSVPLPTTVLPSNVQ